MIKYLNKNVVYPEQARERNIHGKVYVRFVVEKDGSVTNVSVARGLGYGLDTEATRVVKAMPKWQPGKQNGKYVAVRMTLPVNFVL